MKSQQQRCIQWLLKDLQHRRRQKHKFHLHRRQQQLDIQRMLERKEQKVLHLTVQALFHS
jgi:hypothetical protein